MRIKHWKTITSVLLSILLLTGCSSYNNPVGTNQITQSSNENPVTEGDKTQDGITASEDTSGSQDSASGDTITTSALTNLEGEFDMDDYYDESPQEATSITLNKTSVDIKGDGAVVNGSDVTITSEGAYLISGILEDGQLIINAGDEDDVQLIFNNVSLHSNDGAPVYIKNADKVVISLPKGTNSKLSDTADYILPDASSDEPGSTIFSKADLLINGTGSLSIEANYNNAIASKDYLKILSSSLKITSVDDGIVGKDKVVVKEAALTVNAGGDGIKATNTEDAAKGYVGIDNSKLTIISGRDGIHSNNRIVISSGTVNLTSGDDGIHADAMISIQNGDITINKSYEGIESAVITVEGGTILLTSEDDGFNVFDTLTINGGYFYIDAAGDGIDSNGNLYINGGTILVNGPTNDGNGPLDYQGEGKITGGYLIAAGSSGMAQAPGDISAQYSIGVLFTQAQNAGTLVHMEDSSGKDIVTFAPAKSFASLVISSPDIKSGETYTVYTGGTSTGSVENGLFTGGAYKNGTKMVEFKVSDLVTWVNESGITTHTEGFGGMGGGKGGALGGGRQRGNHGAFPGNGTLPEGAALPNDAAPRVDNILPDAGASPDAVSGATGSSD